MEQKAFIEYPTNGCSVGISRFWKLILGQPPTWEYCCDLHDIEYWEGITAKDRIAVDLQFYNCLYKHNPIRATLYFINLRLFGWIWFNLIA